MASTQLLGASRTADADVAPSSLFVGAKVKTYSLISKQKAATDHGAHNWEKDNLVPKVWERDCPPVSEVLPTDHGRGCCLEK